MRPEHLQKVQPLPRSPAPGADAQRRGASRKHLHILQRHVRAIKTLEGRSNDKNLSRWISTAIFKGLFPNSCVVSVSVVNISNKLSFPCSVIQKQMAFMLGRHGMFLELNEDVEDYEDLTEIMSNVQLNSNFLALAREVRDTGTERKKMLPVQIFKRPWIFIHTHENLNTLCQF